jgi:hypothetical protein
MPGITPTQAKSRLNEWMYGIQRKTKTLKRGSRAYMILNYFIVTLAAITTVILLALESYFLGNSALSSGANIGFRGTTLGLQLFLAFLNVTNSVVNPSKKAEKCGDCAKLYDSLFRDMSIQFDRIDGYPEGYSEELHQTLMCYILQETAILQQEPALVFYGHKKEAVVIPKNRVDHTAFKRKIEQSNLDWETKQQIIGYLDNNAVYPNDGYSEEPSSI